MSNAFKIVTGYTGEPHVNSQQDRDVNQGSFGSGCVVLPSGNQLSLEIVSATQLVLHDGALSMQGCVGAMDTGAYITIDVSSGTTGYNRIDYLCVRYENNNGIESMSFVVREGVGSTGTPTPPSYTAGTISAGDTVVEAPVWIIHVSGLSITSVERYARVISSQPQIELLLEAYTGLLDGKAFVLDFSSGDSVNTARTGLALRDVFLFRGTGTYSQDVLGLGTQVNAFGIGYKNSSTSMVLLSICGGKLYYCQYSNTGAGTVYNPLNLQASIT